MTAPAEPVDEAWSRAELAAACRRLALGTAIIVIDVQVDGLDLVNDTIGALVVTAGTVRLRDAVTGVPERQRAGWLTALAVVAVFLSVADQVTGLEAAGWVQLAGVLLLATVLIAEARSRGWAETASRWHLNRQLTLWLGALPMSLAAIASLGQPTRTIETPLALPLVLVLFVPLVHLFVTLQHTWSVAERGIATPPA